MSIYTCHQTGCGNVAVYGPFSDTRPVFCADHATRIETMLTERVLNRGYLLVTSKLAEGVQPGQTITKQDVPEAAFDYGTNRLTDHEAVKLLVKYRYAASMQDVLALLNRDGVFLARITKKEDA